jgi:hypothetical protein
MSIFGELSAALPVSFVNFGIHGVMTALIVFATRHTADRPSGGSRGRRAAHRHGRTCAHVAEIGVGVVLVVGIKICGAGVRFRIRELHRARLR